jgi:hypothetical protein
MASHLATVQFAYDSTFRACGNSNSNNKVAEILSDRQRDHTPPIFNHQIIEKKPSPCSVKLCFTAFLTENLTLEFYERKKHVAIHPHDTRSLQDPNVLQVFPNC